MAKWGEGDPRWIVEERPDATNVNNWHWTEKNAGPWSKDRLEELLVGFDISQDNIICKLTKMDKLVGEASANNRKGKLIFFYEWKMNINWEGRVANASGEVINGQVEIPNLSEENDLDDIEITITVKENTDESFLVKEFLHKVGRDKIRAQLELYISSLKEEFSKGMILPKKDGKVNMKPDMISNITSGFNKKIDMSSTVPKEKTDAKYNSVGVKLDVETIELTEKFQCRAQEFYDAMTKIEMVMAFTKGDASMEPVKGGKFVLFGGNISGEFVELDPGKKIVQRWRYKRWPDSHNSNVTIDLVQKSDHTNVILKQTGVPKCDVEMTKQNWKRYYWDSIKRTFGFGSFF